MRFIVVVAAIVASVSCSAQTPASVDAGHSSAVIEIRSTKTASSGFAAVADVAGKLDMNRQDASRSTVRFSIFPAGAQSIVAPNGKLRSGSYADIADYTVLTFESRRAALRSDGAIAFTGWLTVTHVMRSSTMDANIGYSGAQLGPPVTQSTTHEVTFVMGAPAATRDRQAETEAVATIASETFPGLRTAVLDSTWPPLVEDESCYVPYNFRDYYGSVCTGKTIESPVNAGTPRYGADYPGFTSPGAAGGNLITIMLNLKVR
jgi:polyisoprenoid-binding protein YceI